MCWGWFVCMLYTAWLRWIWPVEQEEKLSDDIEIVSEFTYLSDSVIADGGCEAAVTAITRCDWVKFMECGELLYGRRFPLMLKGAVHTICVSPAILYGSESWCLIRKWDANFTMDRKIHCESNVWSIAERPKEIYRFDVHPGFEGNCGSVGYGKKCSLVWSCVEERGWSRLDKGIGFWGWRSREGGESKGRRGGQRN